jgi:hypothetical protein
MTINSQNLYDFIKRLSFIYFTEKYPFRHAVCAVCAQSVLQLAFPNHVPPQTETVPPRTYRPLLVEALCYELESRRLDS